MTTLNIAIAGSSGRISVEWTVDTDEAGARIFRLVWTETDGPDVESIGHSGFGRVALQRVTPAALGGRGTLQIAKDSIVWTVEAPLSSVESVLQVST